MARLIDANASRPRSVISTRSVPLRRASRASNNSETCSVATPDVGLCCQGLVNFHPSSSDFNSMPRARAANTSLAPNERAGALIAHPPRAGLSTHHRRGALRSQVHNCQTGGLKLTATGNLSRAVVDEMCGSIECPNYDKDELFRYQKVVNEPDFLPLNFGRILVQAAKLIRTYRGKLIPTPLGRSMPA